MSCGFLRETLCSLPYSLSTQAEHSMLLSCVTRFKLLKGCDGTHSLCCQVSERAASGLSDHSRSQRNTRRGIPKQLPAVIKDTKKSHSPLKTPLQVCCPGWVDRKEGDYCLQATEEAAEQLPFGDPLCSCTGCHEALEMDPFPQLVPP